MERSCLLPRKMNMISTWTSWRTSQPPPSSLSETSASGGSYGTMTHIWQRSTEEKKRSKTVRLSPECLSRVLATQWRESSTTASLSAVYGTSRKLWTTRPKAGLRRDGPHSQTRARWQSTFNGSLNRLSNLSSVPIPPTISSSKMGTRLYGT